MMFFSDSWLIDSELDRYIGTLPEGVTSLSYEWLCAICDEYDRLERPLDLAETVALKPANE